MLGLALEGKGIRGELRIRSSETGDLPPLQKQIGEGGWHGLRRVGAKKSARKAGGAQQPPRKCIKLGHVAGVCLSYTGKTQ